MSLSRQLVLLVGSLVLLLFIGTFLISAYNTRHYFESQLASHAQDAATSLGLSATTYVANGDKAMFTAMVNAMIHSGAYLKIRIDDLKGTPLIERHTELNVDVPAWFVGLFPLQPPEGRAAMMSGWNQVGVVRVVSHPGLAYSNLWENTVNTLVWFLIGAALVLLIGLLLLRLLLRPLHRIEQQANAISNRDFPTLEGRPFTLEFRRMLEAMNRLSHKVRQMLDDAERVTAQLRKQVYSDALTGLANRRHFMRLLQSRLEDREAGCGVLLLQINHLAAYNRSHGYQGGDKLIRGIASLMQRLTEGMSGITLARLSGGDFAVLYEGAGLEQLKSLAGRLAQGLGGLYGDIDLPDADVGHIGGALCQGQAPGELMSQIDMALRQAQQHGANAWRVLEAGDVRKVNSASGWKSLLEQALEEGNFRLQKQAVFACPDRRVLHHELFLRLLDPEGGDTMIPAGVFVPMAEAVGLASRVDRWVLTKVMEHAASDGGDGRLAVNMSSASLLDEGFIDWLEASLGEQPGLAGRLILEWSEYAANAHHANLKAWIQRLSPLGVEFSLDHFGKGFSSFSTVRELKLHYLKIDGSFTLDLDSEEGDASFLQAVVGIAHGLDLKIVAESVESETAWERLAAIGVDAGRGYWLAELSAL